jgi:hypothetical protein
MMKKFKPRNTKWWFDCIVVFNSLPTTLLQWFFIVIQEVLEFEVQLYDQSGPYPELSPWYIS